MRSRDQASSHPLLLVFECWETYLLSLDWALLAYWQKSSPKKSSCSTRFVCWCHKGGLEEELPDSMLELRSFLTLPMKPEIRVGIGEASFRSPWFLRFGVGYSINSVREVIDVRLGFRPSRSSESIESSLYFYSSDRIGRCAIDWISFNRLLDGLVCWDRSEWSNPSGRNMPIHRWIRE